MKVAIVDFDHYEMTYSLIKCLAVRTDAIDVYSTGEIIALLKKSQLPKKVSLCWFKTGDVAKLNDTFKTESAYDYVFLNTLNDHFPLANAFLDRLRSGNSKIILTLHNVNYWFTMARRLKVFKRPRNDEHRAMLKIAQKVDAYLVISENQKDYLKYDIGVKKKVIVFPYFIFEPQPQKVSVEKTNKLEIVIPGTLEYGRKDYEVAVEVFKILDKRLFKLVLLGHIKDEYGANILVECQKLQDEGLEVVWFSKYIQPDEFERVMTEADVVFAPIRVNTKHRGIAEVYGRTKATGAIFDLIRYSKPGVFPRSLHIPSEFQDSVVTYTTVNELKEVFNSMLQKRHLLALQAHAQKVSTKYAYANVAESLFQQLSTLN
ncbi:glycosyltransferase [Flavisolibacter ginsenosidimutans]|uniref:Glycosyltransferase family 4 protein n=1 Tax=Flavisolibacter ginsenosidimutans TaxID=661481 RepID=A0A5B8UEY6_9BACT|nr:glycosyltransferase [Flavisolibacter ginsenosidimutans]QEC54866.1 glycosyltransferase family 4 protein [Flavisolibacter ginsenosidimutans]